MFATAMKVTRIGIADGYDMRWVEVTAAKELDVVKTVYGFI